MSKYYDKVMHNGGYYIKKNYKVTYAHKEIGTDLKRLPFSHQKFIRSVIVD